MVVCALSVLLYSVLSHVFLVGTVKVATNEVVVHHALLYRGQCHVIAEYYGKILVVILYAVIFVSTVIWTNCWVR